MILRLFRLKEQRKRKGNSEVEESHGCQEPPWGCEQMAYDDDTLKSEISNALQGIIITHLQKKLRRVELCDVIIVEI